MRQHDHNNQAAYQAADVVVGSIGRHPVRFSAGHRVGNDTPAVTALEVSLPVSFADITAALWVATGNGVWQTDMAADPDAIHAVVAYTLVNHNTDVAAARRELDTVPDGSSAWETVIGLRMAVVRAYGTDAPPADYSHTDRAANGGRAGLRIVPD
jgi:hypothetical protein